MRAARDRRALTELGITTELELHRSKHGPRFRFTADDRSGAEIGPMRDTWGGETPHGVLDCELCRRWSDLMRQAAA